MVIIVGHANVILLFEAGAGINKVTIVVEVEDRFLYLRQIIGRGYPVRIFRRTVPIQADSLVTVGFGGDPILTDGNVAPHAELPIPPVNVRAIRLDGIFHI